MTGSWRQWQPGMRVVVRYRLHGERFGHSDALGELREIDEEALTVLTKRGPVRVPAADVVLAKRVPPPPPPRPRR